MKAPRFLSPTPASSRRWPRPVKIQANPGTVHRPSTRTASSVNRGPSSCFLTTEPLDAPSRRYPMPGKEAGAGRPSCGQFTYDRNGRAARHDLWRHVVQQAGAAGNHREDERDSATGRAQPLEKRRLRPRRHNPCYDEAEDQAGEESEERHADDEITGAALERRDVVPVDDETGDRAGAKEREKPGQESDDDRGKPTHIDETYTKAQQLWNSQAVRPAVEPHPDAWMK